MVIRKVERRGHTVAFWVGRSGDVRGWIEGEGFGSVEQEMATGGGWIAEEGDAGDCGTTLSALRAELMQEGK
jgi:hypothetical protein